MTDAPVTLADIAGFVEDMRAQERADALAKAEKTRITFEHMFSVPGRSGPRICFETVVDQGIEPHELDALLDDMVRAVKRREAIEYIEASRGWIESQYEQIRSLMRDRAAEETRFNAENAARSVGRRNPVELTKQQQAALATYRKNAEVTRAQIVARREEIAELCEKWGQPVPDFAKAEARSAA